MVAVKRVYTGTECRELDRIAIDETGISGIELMNRAGRFAYDQLRIHFPDARSIKIIAGSGNNAGDGYVVAGTAKQRGLDVRLQQVGDENRLQGDAKLAWNWMRRQGVKPDTEQSASVDVVVDALLGTGATGDIRPEYQEAISWIRRGRHRVLALDLPSGINGNTGGAMTEEPVIADVTCTFVGAKLGLFTGAGIDCAGRVELSDLTIPTEVFERVRGLELLDPDEPENFLPRRGSSSHKGQLGHVLVVGGDLGSGGAAILTAEAALRTGAGLVTTVTRTEHVGAFLARCPEVMVVGMSSGDDIAGLVGNADVVAVGPGMGQSAWSKEILSKVLNAKPSRLVIDAGALRLLDGNPLPSNSIITPHPGEAGHLLASTSQQVQQDRPAAIKQITKRLNCVGILKGAGSLVASHGDLLGVVRCANPALATAGSGDVLTGIVATASAQLESAAAAAKTAVLLHCRAARDAVIELGERSIVAGDLVQNIRPWDAD